MPDTQLRGSILGASTGKASSAAGSTQCRHVPAVPNTEHLTGVDETMALKGLATEQGIKRRFKEVHRMSLGNDAGKRS